MRLFANRARVLERWRQGRKMANLARCSGAGDEIRNHDPNLGKVVLYP